MLSALNIAGCRFGMDFDLRGFDTIKGSDVYLNPASMQMKQGYREMSVFYMEEMGGDERW